MHKLRKENDIRLPQTTTVGFGEHSLAYFSHFVWDMVPTDYKKLESFSKFKKKIRSWKPDKCSCKLCKTYIKQVGLVTLYE